MIIYIQKDTYAMKSEHKHLHPRVSAVKAWVSAEPVWQDAGRKAWIEQFYWEWIMDQLVLKSTYKQND